MLDTEIEKEIQEKNLNAPRLNPDMINEVIKDSYFHVVPNTTMTLCVLTLQNGFQVTGESAAASLENFDKELGEKIAYDNAKNKIWALEGYLLKDKLFNEPKTARSRVQLELDELEDKLDKLREFTKTDMFESLTNESQSLLESQKDTMKNYEDILKLRLGTWK